MLQVCIRLIIHQQILSGPDDNASSNPSEYRKVSMVSVNFLFTVAFLINVAIDIYEAIIIISSCALIPPKNTHLTPVILNMNKIYYCTN